MSTKIQAKYEAAAKAVESAKASIAKIVGEGFDAGRIGEAANTLAQAEGALSFWARMENVASNFEARGEELTQIVATNMAMDILTRGADDTWSGRGNDINRARFDGIRQAAAKLEYTF